MEVEKKATLGQLLTIVQLQTGMCSKITDYQFIPFLQGFKASSWQKTLIGMRVKPFLRLLLLHTFDPEEPFLWLTSGITASLYEETIEQEIPELLDQQTFGPNMIVVHFTAMNLFQHILDHTSIITVSPLDPATITFQKRIGQEGELPTVALETKKYALDSPDFYWMSQKTGELIIENQGVWILKNHHSCDKIKTIIKHYESIFKEYLEQQKDAVTIDHDQYIKWLREWFPGWVHFLELGHNS